MPIDAKHKAIITMEIFKKNDQLGGAFFGSDNCLNNFNIGFSSSL